MYDKNKKISFEWKSKYINDKRKKFSQICVFIVHQ